MDKCPILPVADLYIRVSTEEQADKGFSQRYQEEVIRRHCEVNSIQIKSVIYEDYSAKTFNRPQWIKLFKSYKVNKGSRPQLLLFTKWDRFSRNTAEAYATIRSLEAWSIQPVAIEQPLDITIPEMTIAFYLTISEVENARRSLNIKQGIRRAKKEGRCPELAPVGYIKNCFWRAIRNPLYCGKILVRSTTHEHEQYAQGTHESIIPETIFLKVQHIINKKKQKHPRRSNIENLFPLR